MARKTAIDKLNEAIAGMLSEYGEDVGKNVGDIPIYDFAELPARQRSSGVAIAVIAVPSQNAQEVANTLIESNIKAIWNFTPYRIKVPRNVVLQNTSIYSDLAIMYNRMEASANNNILRK